MGRGVITFLAFLHQLVAYVTYWWGSVNNVGAGWLTYWS